MGKKRQKVVNVKLDGSRSYVCLIMEGIPRYIRNLIN
jgi:hypothetical protein